MRKSVLVSTAETGHFYTTDKTNVICLKNGNQKFDPVVRKRVIYKEAKSNNFADLKKPDIVRVLYHKFITEIIYA